MWISRRLFIVLAALCAPGIVADRRPAELDGWLESSPDLPGAFPAAEGTADLYSSCFVPTPSVYSGLNASNCAASGYREAVNHPAPPCILNENQLVYINGQLSAERTFRKCQTNLDALSMPTLRDGARRGCLLLRTALTPINLVRIDELKGTARLQVVVHFQWSDFRYNMSLFWERVSAGQSGVDLSAALRVPAAAMWLPAVTFPDASDVAIQGQTLLSMPDPFVFQYSLVLDLTLVQPLFDFRTYPRDSQTLSVRYSVLGHDASELQMFPLGLQCSGLQDGSCSFTHNPIWTHQAQADHCSVYYTPRPRGWQAYTLYSISMQRAPAGATLRIAAPLVLLAGLSALTFWIDNDHRVNVTITLLLATSALYTVVVQNTPPVGYLTTVDTFVFAMFLLLACVALSHQVYGTLREKLARWPLRLLYMRVIELCGRTLVLPAVAATFALTVHPAGRAFAVTTALVTVAIFARECLGVHTTLRVALERLADKAAACAEPGDLSTTEMLALDFRSVGWRVLLTPHGAKRQAPMEVALAPGVELHHSGAAAHRGDPTML